MVQLPYVGLVILKYKSSGPEDPTASPTGVGVWLPPVPWPSNDQARKPLSAFGSFGARLQKLLGRFDPPPTAWTGVCRKVPATCGTASSWRKPGVGHGSAIFRRLWLSKPMESHFGVGEFTTRFRTYLNGDWDVHWGYGLLTHGPIPKPEGRVFLRPW